jgi:anti-sigma-K factor RskA
MIDERHEELASLHALDLLEGAERVAFEEKLSSDAKLRRLVEQLRAALVELAHVAPSAAPSADLKNRVLASIAAESAAPGAPRAQTFATSADSKNEKLKTKIISFPLLSGWAAAACFALLAAFFGARYFAARSSATLAVQEAELARLETRSLTQRLEAERILNARQIADLQKAGDVANLKIAKLADLLGNTPQAVAIAVWNPLSQEGMLTVEKLPVLQRDQDYQLWVIDPAYQDPVNGGVFTVDEKGVTRFAFRPDQPVTAATTFAITRERKGGVKKTQGPILAAGTL